ncbi:MAG TPA: hypothetical protein VH256_07595 [Thermoleophilaceae bacterium]|jgi:hypothetical protein|nr:hypothetical protein [Thermoleophilaceae bacterium]
MAKKKKGEQPTTITPAGSDDVKVSSHPRAARQIRRAKGWGGLAGFALMAWFSWRSGTDFVHLGLRALLGGMVTYVATWAAAVYIWRQVALAEVRQRARVLAERKFASADGAAERASS